MEALIIPEGYVLVPESWAEKFFAKMNWTEITEPTTSDVCAYLGISTDKLKKDLHKPGCPLKVTYEGGKGRRNEKRFLKLSVEHYKTWINK